jgi:hypothetical protein
VFEGTAPSPSAVVRMIRGEAELWKAVGLFRVELALVDRWRLGEYSVCILCCLSWRHGVCVLTFISTVLYFNRLTLFL